MKVTYLKHHSTDDHRHSHYVAFDHSKVATMTWLANLTFLTEMGCGRKKSMSAEIG